MRVLWLATAPSLYDEQKVMGWIASLERIVRKYCTDIDLGIAFEFTDDKFKVQRDNVVYYPISLNKTFKDICKMKCNGNDDWYLKGPRIHQVIDDFCPDIIHCFGSEWNWGLITRETDIPVVIHMQGFINIYHHAETMVRKRKPTLWFDLMHPREVLQRIFQTNYSLHRNENERNIMKSCRYFMGRTEWDKNICKFYSPNSTYFHCSEAIRPELYESNDSWVYHPGKKLRIVTIASAGNLKGNGIILQTAKIMTEMGVDFEWRISGNRNHFAAFERSEEIQHDKVNIKLLGFISADEVKKELLQAELFVLPSIMDNSPNSLCEAQLIGTPVVATYVGGIPQMVENGKTGILYPYNEPYTLAYTLLNLHESPNLLQELSRNERIMAKERHNPEKIAKRLVEIYNKILIS